MELKFFGVLLKKDLIRGEEPQRTQKMYKEHREKIVVVVRIGAK